MASMEHFWSCLHCFVFELPKSHEQHHLSNPYASWSPFSTAYKCLTDLKLPTVHLLECQDYSLLSGLTSLHLSAISRHIWGQELSLPSALAQFLVKRPYGMALLSVSAVQMGSNVGSMLCTFVLIAVKMFSVRKNGFFPFKTWLASHGAEARKASPPPSLLFGILEANTRASGLLTLFLKVGESQLARARRNPAREVVRGWRQGRGARLARREGSTEVPGSPHSRMESCQISM